MTELRQVLYVHSGDNWIAGSERVLLDIVESLDRSRFRPTALCSSEVLARELAARGVKSKVFPLATVLPYGGRSFPAYLKSVAQVRNLIREENIDLLHATSAISMQYALPAAKMAGIPSIAHVQGKHLKSSRVGAFVPWADAVVAVSKWVSSDYLVAGNRLSIVSNGINTDRFSRNIVERARVRRDLGISPDEPVVGMVGQLLPGKRPLLFVDIALAVCTKFPTARFILAGAGKLERDVVAAVAATGLSGRILVLGYRTDVPSLLSAMDVFLFTSRTEALGLAPLEAASSGLPVVAGAATAIPEVVEDGKTGFLVDPDDVDAYAESCLKLLEDGALAQRMGAAGREMILRKFSLEAFRMNIDQLYRRFLSVE